MVTDFMYSGKRCQILAVECNVLNRRYNNLQLQKINTPEKLPEHYYQFTFSEGYTLSPVIKLTIYFDSAIDNMPIEMLTHVIGEFVINIQNYVPNATITFNKDVIETTVNAFKQAKYFF